MFFKKPDKTKKSLNEILLDDKNKKDFVHQMFENIAADYDKMNEIMTLGLNRKIKRQVIKNVPIKPGMRILDVCCGTGDFSVFIADYFKDSCKITGIDFSQNMLNIAKQKADKFNNVEFIEGDALKLPFDDGEFDACFIGYGLRNLVDLESGIQQMKRVTKKGGYVVNLDLGKPEGILSNLLRLYIFNIVPVFGQIFHGDCAPYQYLPQSNENFPSQNELVKIFKEQGFSEVKNYNYIFGLLAQQVAEV